MMSRLSWLTRLTLTWAWAITSVVAQAADGCATQSAVMPASMLEAPGVGGTGSQALKPGLGGTGIDGGMGGTGIVGVITGFASVCVNGVEVHLDTSTPVSEDGADVPLSALAVGKLVAIQATGSGPEYAARRIAVLNAVVGPVGAVNRAEGSLQVLGQTVWAPSAASVSDIRVGQWVQVSGYRRTGGAIEASFVGPIAARAEAQLRGPVERLPGGEMLVGGTPVRLAGATLPDSVERGSEVSVQGVWNGAALQARALDSEPTRRSLGGAREVLVEGLVHSADGKSINLGAQRWQLAERTEVRGGSLKDLAANQRVRVFAQVGPGQRMEARRIDIDRSSRRSSSTTSSSDPDRIDDSNSSDRKSERSSDDSRSGSSDSDSGKSTDTSGKSGSTSGTSGSSSGSDSSGSSGTSGSSGSSGSGSSSGSSRSGSSGSSGGSGKSSGK